MTLAQALAHDVLAYDGAMPADVRAKLKTCLIDFLSCAFETLERGLPWGRQAIAVTRATAASEVGANIVGSGITAAPGDAAFVNSVLGHGLVREDMHAGSIAHHGVVVWPVLLALAQRTPTPGDAFLVSAVLAYEAAARIGRALFNAELARLYRPTGLVSPLGAALGAGRMLQLPEAQIMSAFSLTINTVGGLNQWPHNGGSEMYFHPGFAARNTIAALELAEQDAFASPDILEGEAGLFAAYRRGKAPGAITLFEGGRFEILEVFNKPAPACNFAQTACQAAVRVAERTGRPSSDIARIRVHVTDAAVRYPGCDASGPFDRSLQAKMSIRFSVAAALARGAITEENYANPRDPEIIRLIAMTSVEPEPAFTAAFPGKQGAEVHVTFTDGSETSERLEDVVQATDAEVRVRFRQSAAVVIGAPRAAEIEGLIDALEDAPDAGLVARLCALEETRVTARRSALN
jgi:2-methylcitrate dehydratase PrpD